MNNSKTLHYVTPEEAGMLPDRIEKVKQLAAGWVASGHTPSLVILAARKGKIFLHEAYGVLTPEADSPPLRIDSIFPISSLTKTITATAVMILMEDGLLSLNRPVFEYIPELCGKGAKSIQIHHLLTHTSGFNDEILAPFVTEEKGIKTPPCPENQHPLIHELLYRLFPTPLFKHPGIENAYCSYNYELLGEIVRRVSGRSLADFAAERIFRPLGMNDTYFVVPESLDDRIVKRPADAPYAQSQSPKSQSPYLGPFGRFFDGLNSRQVQEVPSASGGAFSTAINMAVFGQMFMNGGQYGDQRILNSLTVSEMTRNQIPGIDVNYFGTLIPEAGSWGYGWIIAGDYKWRYFLGDLRSSKTFMHTGAGGTLLFVDPVNEILLVYFSVVLEVTPRFEAKTNNDLFENAVYASIKDPLKN
jgi:serine-type D-Ala-D-Ala carboxypeptidase